MAWTAPRTWVHDAVVTAAQLNEQIRDNLNETMCAKARTNGGHFTTLEALDVEGDPDDENHTHIVERKCASHRIATSETLTGAASTWTDLTTVGPTVSVETGQQALIFMSCTMMNTVTSFQSVMSWEISGATNRVVYFDPISLIEDGAKQVGAPWNFSQADHMRGLVPGLNTFTCKYRKGGGDATFKNRFLAVFPL